MTDVNQNLAALRNVMANFPPLESHAPRNPIDLTEIYLPKSHAAALDPDRSLVIGNRGMGKSFWASALVNPDSRRVIANALPEARLNADKIDVHFGFAEGEGSVGISRDELALLVKGGSQVEQIWRAVTLQPIAKIVGKKVPINTKDRIRWVASEPGDVREMMRSADALLTERKGKLIFVFDQLEQLADDLELRSDLTQGILRLALAFKSYRGLRVKIFMRPDHFAEDRLFHFPDASKVKGEALLLDWRGIDLYGLLYTRLLKDRPNDFKAVVNKAGVPAFRGGILPSELKSGEESQHRIFDLIAGDVMGARTRGLPYTWLMSHLADARNQVSPRTFLRALKYAAEHSPPPTGKAIDHYGIHEGVREASKNRVDDLKEDYPWVRSALYALSGLLVPCTPKEMIGKWQSSGRLMEQLRTDVPQIKQPRWLARAVEGELASYEALLNSMADIGVIEIRTTTGKVDVPDIFRLPAGIKRKGGITQQQRRRARAAIN